MASNPLCASPLLKRLGRQPPVDLLLHPMTLGALALMIFNDGWLRGAYPGWVTGKLSDFAAVLAYPGLLTALWGVAAMAADRVVSRLLPPRGADYSLGPGVILGACTITGVILAGINLWPPFRDGYLTVLRWLDPGGFFGPFHYTMDASDLIALLLLPVVWLAGRRALARVPTGRLRALYRTALREAPTASEDEIRVQVDRGLVDVRRALGDREGAALDTLRDQIVRAALSEANPGEVDERNVAFDPSEHYHRLRQALETHRNRGVCP